jgi:hypothetical protein
MRRFILGAVGAAILLAAAPVAAQGLPLVGGDYWDVTSVKIDDGHFSEYADFLVSKARNRMSLPSRRAGSKHITF